MFFGWGLRLAQTGPNYGGGGFAPLRLFALGEQGVWYDPSDLTTLSQDAAGAIPVTGVEQPVGLMLDKSGRGNHATQSTAASRPILSARVNRYVGTTTLATQNITTLATTYTLSFSGAGSITLSGTATGTFVAGTHSVVTTAGTLTSTVSGTVTNADIRAANEAIGSPSYQRVTTSTDYDTVGFPLYLRLDGVDDGMVTSSIDFTGTDKVSVFAGIRQSTTTVSVPLELSSSVSSAGNVGSLALVAGSTLESYLRGSTGLAAVSCAIGASPASYVSTTAFNIAGAAAADEVKPRLNGVAFANATVAGPAGTGNFGNHPLYLFRRGGISFPLNGHFYGLIIRGALTDDPTIIKVEKLLATKTGVTLA